MPYSAGAASDILARRLGEGMSKLLKTPVIVENVAGAGGVTGTLRAQRAAPDGHTLLIGTQGTHMMNKFIYKNLKYDPDTDFIPVSNLVSFPNLVLVPSSLKIASLREFIALAKARAKEGRPLTYGSGGIGSSSHIGAELFKMEAGIELTHVPYKAVADTTSDLLSGRIDVTFGTLGTFAPQVLAGDLVGLAVTAPERSAILPQVPTIREAGFPGAEFTVWLGLFAPANTPPALIDEIRQAAIASMAVSSTRAAFAAEGADVQASSSTSFADFIKEDSQRWKPIIKKLAIELQS
ncbi:Bug family tripartite tricarboxylate transporter substrate binding protein [Microvirga sp. P5_D2]